MSPIPLRARPALGGVEERGRAYSWQPSVASQGMWRVFQHQLHMPIELRLITFAFLEVAMLVCAIRARSNVADPNIGKAGQEGAAVWALTGLSALIAATDAQTWHEALVRLVAPLTAAWLWERGLHVQRKVRADPDRPRGWLQTINWRVTPELILIRVGLAEASKRGADEVDAHRRLTRVARAARRLQVLRSSGGGKWWRQRRAHARLVKVTDQAIEHTGFVDDEKLLDALMARIGALSNAGTLADVYVRPPWALGRSSTDSVAITAGGVVISAATSSPGLQSAADNTTDGAADISRPADTSAGDNDGQKSTGTDDSDDADSPVNTGDKNAQRATVRRPPAHRARTSGARRADQAASVPRRSMDEWIQLAGPLLAAETRNRGKPPTARQFAAAIAEAGFGNVSDTTAKNIRAAIGQPTPPGTPSLSDVASAATAKPATDAITDTAEDRPDDRTEAAA